MATVSSWNKIYYISLIFFASVFLYLHHLASLSFPIPWPDEGTFMWQALSIANHSTLLSPNLNPDKHIMWMPPGYMIVQGLIFKLTGFSLEWARYTSTIYILASMFILFSITKKYPIPGAALVLIGAFLLSYQFVFAGNMARMEGLVLLSGLFGLWLLIYNHMTLSFAALLICPLIHPNGVYFLGCGFLLIVGTITIRKPKLTICKTDLLILTIPLLFYVAYGIYIWQQWNEFVEHMTFQFTIRSYLMVTRGGFWSVLTETENLVSLLIFSASIVIGFVKKTEYLYVFGLLGLALKILTMLGGANYYNLFEGICYLLISLIAVQIFWKIINNHLSTMLGKYRYLLVTLLVMILLGINYKLDNLGLPLKSTSNLKMWDMHITLRGVPYISSVQKHQINAFLSSLTSNHHPIKVIFYPQSDALMFSQLNSEKLRFIQPTFMDENNSISDVMKPDVHIYHRSKYIPNMLKNVHKDQLDYFRKGLEDQLNPFPNKNMRDDTNSWYYFIDSPDIQAKIPK